MGPLKLTTSLPALKAGLAAAALLAIAAPAQAANPLECGIYANQAVQQQAVNLQNQCGFFGVRWLSDAAAHLAWCIGATKGQMNSERNIRNTMLNGCLSGGGGVPTDIIFQEPMIGGWRLDWCRFWAAQCGQPAANAYCQTKGYTHSAGFALASNIGTFVATKVIGTGQVCNGPDCDGFAWIKCSN